MDNPSPQDQELAQRAAQGDKSAFHDLVDRHYTTVFRMAYRFCNHRENAEDLTQMACLKLASSIGQFRGDAAFTTWLYTLVLNTYRDWLRGAGGKARAELDIETTGAHLQTRDNPEHNAGIAQHMARIKQLPEAEFEAVILVFAEGLSHKEAAKIVGCAESTISWRIHEARKKLVDQEGGHNAARQ